MSAKKVLLLLTFLLAGQCFSLWSWGKVKYNEGFLAHAEDTKSLLIRKNIGDTHSCVLMSQLAVMSYVTFVEPLEMETPRQTIKICMAHLNSYAKAVEDEKKSEVLGEVKLYLDSYFELVDKIVAQEEAIRQEYNDIRSREELATSIDLIAKMAENQQQLEEANKFAKRIVYSLAGIM